MHSSRLSQHKSSCYHLFQCWRNIFAVIAQSDFISDKPNGNTPQQSWHSWEFVPGLCPCQEQFCRCSEMKCAHDGDAGGSWGAPRWSPGPGWDSLLSSVWLLIHSAVQMALCANNMNCLSTPEPSAPSHQHWRSSSSFTPNSTWKSLPMVTDGRCPAPAIPGREMTAALGEQELSGFISPLLAAYLLLYSFKKKV